MNKDWWSRFKKSFNNKLVNVLLIFSAEDEFVRRHKNKGAMLDEQKRYGKSDKD
ncbi:MAG: hypothetical protein Q3959_05375 [Limosilactobacillus sp.]|uniref:hypothetical protein n=1 Tax=Limosilactobacillus sp. TaxID=2773925 RepID=UPI002702343E|nr:hypothetical protein [Limosilactobacillus sp.]